MILTDKNKYFLERARAQYGRDVNKIYDYSGVNYERAKSQLTIRCIKHDNTFTQRADVHLKGGIGCKLCKKDTPLRAKVKNTKDVIRIGTRLHGDLDTYEKTNYINSKIKIIVTCKIHGDYEISPKSYLQGARCSKCGVENKYITKEEAKAICASVHGDTYEYNWDTYKNSSSKMDIKCKIHGWFRQRMNTHMSGHGCVKCGVASRTFTQSNVLHKIKHHFRNRYTYEKFVYVNDDTFATLTCNKHGDFIKEPHELMRGNGCPKCRESKPERDMCNILMDNNIEYVQEYGFPGIRYKYDICLPKLNVLIEIDGMSHYKSIDHYGGDKALQSSIKRDEEKNELAKKHNMFLIRIPYFKFNVMKDTFFLELSKIYKYRVGDKFYKLFIDMLMDLKLPATTSKGDMDKYLTHKKTQSS